jgi:hypothetical protein
LFYFYLTLSYLFHLFYSENFYEIT